MSQYAGLMSHRARFRFGCVLIGLTIQSLIDSGCSADDETTLSAELGKLLNSKQNEVSDLTHFRRVIRRLLDTLVGNNTREVYR